MSDTDTEGKHTYSVQVTYEAQIDPDRVEEWLRANFTEDKTVVLRDLDSSDAFQLDSGEFHEAL